MKGIFRGLVVAIVAFGLYWGVKRAIVQYDLYKADTTLSERIDASPREQQRMLALASYLGFYWGGGVVIPDVCKHEGVDLGTFSAEFTERFAHDHAIARTAFEQASGTSERMMLNVAAADGAVRKRITGLLEKIGDRFGKDGTVAAGCATVASKRSYVLDFLDYRKSFPQSWKRTELP
jgi:hypothetical protein